MILADTSIWADHLGRSHPVMAALLEEGRIVIHPFVQGELALGNLKRRAATLADLADLPQAHVAEADELLLFIERHALHGSGIGYVDAHLLASVMLTPGTGLWTRDKRLLAAAERLGVAAKPLN